MEKINNELFLKNAIVLCIKGATNQGLNSVSMFDIPKILNDVANDYK